MGIFRSDPQPVQLTPHVPASALTTGSQPPRIASQLAMAMAVVGMAWPQAGEPHPIQPMQGRSQIAPLTLVYGQQPPIAGPLSVTETAIAVLSWEPARSEPPKLIGSAAWNAPVVILPVGPITPQEMAVVRSAWEPPAPIPPFPVKIAPLTLVYGQAPPVDGPLTETELNIAIAPLAWWPPQNARPSAAWNIPPIAAGVPFTPLPLNIVGSWQTDWRAQSAGLIAPLTLVYGQQPPVQGPLTVPSLTAILSPRDIWTSQSEPDNAHWNVPPISAFLSFARLPQSVLAAWLPPDSGAQSRGPIAPLTLAYGQQPPLVGAITPAELNEVVRAWDSFWAAQSQAPNAAWNIPAVVNNPIPRVPQQHGVRYSWEPPFQFPQTLLGPAAWNFVAIISRAIAQSDASDALFAALSSSSGLIVINSGVVAVLSADSESISIISVNDATVSINSVE